MNRANINGIKALILDMDGVIWRGEQPIGDLPAIFAAHHSRKLAGDPGYQQRNPLDPPISPKN